ncbi:MAG TPA: MBL fold metallo-hydrolase [Thermodesulfobacteriota bacterium]|nr:MBL fold metallo-hydrolase [Thermodesulfobacteriota bacterium]
MVPGLNPGPFTGRGTNTYLVGEGRPVLIDTGAGVPAYADALRRALAAEAGPLAAVLVTHHHPDHQGGLAQVKALAPQAPVFKRPHPRDLVPPDRPLAGEGEEPAAIEVEGARLIALYTPGHASDHLCFYWEEARALFTGDLVLGGTTPVIPAGDGDLAAYLASLERLLALDLEVLYPGHGEPIGDPHAYIRHYLAHRRMREAQVLDALRAGLATPAEIAARLYPDVAAAVRQAAREQVLAHLVKLEREGVVAREPAAEGPAAHGEAAGPRFRLR